MTIQAQRIGNRARLIAARRNATDTQLDDRMGDFEARARGMPDVLRLVRCVGTAHTQLDQLGAAVYAA